MLHQRARRSLAVTGLVISLMTPCLGAAESGSRPVPRVVAGGQTRWESLARLWQAAVGYLLGFAAPSPVAVKCDSGGSLDPDGRCRYAISGSRTGFAAPPPVSVACDSGGSLDPNGRCR
jgi:hypothetical protein